MTKELYETILAGLGELRMKRTTDNEDEPRILEEEAAIPVREQIKKTEEVMQELPDPLVETNQGKFSFHFEIVFWE